MGAVVHFIIKQIQAFMKLSLPLPKWSFDKEGEFSGYPARIYIKYWTEKWSILKASQTQKAQVETAVWT